MRLLNFASWSVNVKIFVLVFVAFMILNLINTPVIIETINNANRQAFQQVVTESALRQKDAINDDFDVALSNYEQFKSEEISNLTFYYKVQVPSSRVLVERILENDFLSTVPSLVRQVWLINIEGEVISNVTNFINPRFDVSDDEFPSALDTPAFRAGELLGQSSSNTSRNTDIVVERIGDELSIQLVSAIFDIQGEYSGTFVVELNNIGVFTSNMRLTSANQDIYSFIVSTEYDDIVITPGATNQDLINVDTQATRSSAALQVAQSYPSGERQVIGFYTPVFDGFRNDVIFIVELDEQTALQNVAILVASSSTTIVLLQIFILLLVIIVVNQVFVNPINRVTNTIRSISAGDLTSSVAIQAGDDEIGKLVEATVELRQQLTNYTNDMSSRVDARTRDLQVTQEIGRAAISETDLDRLMTQVVNLITERFDQIYHAQIFLIEGNYAVLKASTGEVGQQLLARGHRLGIGGLSVIGQVTQQNQSIIARDTATSEIHRQNEFLQETRTELATPIRLGSRIIGALDVQSTIRDAFDDDLVTIIETMTSQIAIAIENSRLYEQSQRRLQEFERSTRQRTEHNWTDFMNSQRTQQLMTHSGAKITNDFSSLRQQVVETHQIAIGSVTNRDTIPIALPVIIRGQILGVIELEVSEQEFSQDRILLAEELSSRLAISLDNARLVQAGRQTAENERIINTISAKISGQTDIEQILQTAIQEVGQALRAPRVNVRLQPNTSNNGHNDNDHQPTSNT